MNFNHIRSGSSPRFEQLMLQSNRRAGKAFTSAKLSDKHDRKMLCVFCSFTCGHQWQRDFVPATKRCSFAINKPPFASDGTVCFLFSARRSAMSNCWVGVSFSSRCEKNCHRFVKERTKCGVSPSAKPIPRNTSSDRSVTVLGQEQRRSVTWESVHEK